MILIIFLFLSISVIWMPRSCKIELKSACFRSTENKLFRIFDGPMGTDCPAPAGKSFVKPFFSAENDCFMKTVNKLLTISTIPRREYTSYIVPERKICKWQKQNLFNFIFHFFLFWDLTNHVSVIFRQIKNIPDPPCRGPAFLRMDEPVPDSHFCGYAERIHKSLTAFLKSSGSSIYK